MAKIKKQKSYFYPVTSETMHQYAASIFKPINRGECVTTIWVPMAGRRMWNKFIIENIELFKKELPGYQKCLLVYIEPLDLTTESLAGYLRLMGRSLVEACQKHEDCRRVVNIGANFKIFTDESASYSRLLRALKLLTERIVKAGLKVIFFLGEFDELIFANTIFYNNLRSFWGQFQPRLSFAFLMREEVTTLEKAPQYGDFNEVVLQNIIYVPLLSRRDADYVITRLSESFSYKASKKEIDILKNLCGGHPYMLKVGLRTISRLDGEKMKTEVLEKVLLDHYELQAVARGILEPQTEKVQALLKKIARGNKASGVEQKTFQRLQKLGLVETASSGETQTFGEIFKEVILGKESKGDFYQKENGKLRLDEEGGAVYLGTRIVDEKFTRQEYAVLTMLLQKAGKICTRDDISEVLWGKESYEKYSNWAIDQIISKLRKKLELLDVKKGTIVTARGRGYKFSPS